MRRNPLASESGATLGIVMIVAFVMLLSIMTILSIGSQDAVLARHDHQWSQAFYLAEAGLERAESWLEAQPAFPTIITYPFGEDPEVLGDGQYIVLIAPDTTNWTATRPSYTVTSTGTVGGRARTLQIDMAPQSFADFLYFTDIEHEIGTGNPCWFCSADVIDGPLHTNDQISIFGDPVFRDGVVSAWGGPDDSNKNHNKAFMYYNGDANGHIESPNPSNPPYDEPAFEGGYELGGSAIDMPNVLAKLKELADAGGITLITLSGYYEIVFSRIGPAGTPLDGYVSYRKPDKNWTDIPIDSFNGMIYITGGAQVSGTLDGRLTIATSSNMYIVDDIIYADSDENGPTETCDDVLGLVSGSDIVIENNEPNQSDLTIHAAMMALNTSFRADGYNVGDPRGTLAVYGGIVQQVRGAVGTGWLDADGNVTVVTGYEKDYHYDYRLRDMPPPGFFQTGNYKRLCWRELAVAG
ncbi:MAG: DUF4900 domain-containing protein [Candidatus Eisenbacteria bacterium]|nr:DUF4900 domain-containing protein [Candidatus Eisenbacteria bacterium]